MLYILILLVFTSDGYYIRPAGVFDTIEQCGVIAQKAATKHFANCREIKPDQVNPAWRSATI